jgi:dolichol-phosphate mannosyltransferase
LGTAYRGGFQRALADQYERVFQMDADFSHDPADLVRLLRATDEGADVAIGSRYVDGGGTRNWSLRRRILSRGGSFYARTILGVGVRDLTAGFKCWRREALQRIQLDAVRSEGYGFQIEMTYRAIRQGLRVVEVPILFTERRAGASKMSGGIITEAIVGVWRLRARV